MKSIRMNVVYLHDGQKLSPKLVYGVPDAVADGFVAIGVAIPEKAEPDLTLEYLSWDIGTVRSDVVTPEPLDNEQEVDV